MHESVVHLPVNQIFLHLPAHFSSTHSTWSFHTYLLDSIITLSGGGSHLAVLEKSILNQYAIKQEYSLISEVRPCAVIPGPKEARCFTVYLPQVIMRSFTTWGRRHTLIELDANSQQVSEQWLIFEIFRKPMWPKVVFISTSRFITYSNV